MQKIITGKDKPNYNRYKQIMNECLADGIKIDTLNSELEQLDKEVNEISDKLKEVYGLRNFRSAKQVEELLIRESRKLIKNGSSNNDIVEYAYDSKKQKWTTAKEALTPLEQLGYEFAELIMRGRRLSKLASTIRNCNSFIDANGKVHPEISMTYTNRCMFKDPGILTIRKDYLWKMIKSPSSDFEIVTADVHNQEPNIMLMNLGAEEQNKYLRKEYEFYKEMAKQVYGLKAKAIIVKTDKATKLKRVETIEEALDLELEDYFGIVEKPVLGKTTVNGNEIKISKVDLYITNDLKDTGIENKVTVKNVLGETEKVDVAWKKVKNKGNNVYLLIGEIKDLETDVLKETRDTFKRMWIATSYGATLKTLKPIQRNLDSSLLMEYFSELGKYSELEKKAKSDANKGIRTRTTIFGTEIVVPQYESRNNLKRKLINIPNQGAGADVMAIIFERAYDRINSDEELKDNLKIYFQIVDNIVFLVKKEFIERKGEKYIEELIKDMVEYQIDDWVPVNVDVRFEEREDKKTVLFEEDYFEEA